MGWPLGCQVMPWLQAQGLALGEASRDALPDIIRSVAAIGFRGFETLMPNLPLDEPGPLLETMAASGGIRLAAAHAAGAWWDPAAAGRIAELVAQARALRLLGCDRLVVSLFPRPDAGPTAEHIACAVRALGRLGRACREEAGVAIGFHNHPWEMTNDARVIAALVEGCPPEDIQLAPDLGWVAIGGVDPVEFIHRFGSRIAYLHARGVTELGPGGCTVEVGQGILDYDHIAAALERADFRGWVVAESEYRPPWAGNDDPDASARLHMQGLRAALRRR
jgi:sugar phosphate isomerase/epimerase